jgi:hypothetical protein|tara:strand:+ start:416 stop:583 length:168 start_codon:yes stop_codon:yes gene_type:complete
MDNETKSKGTIYRSDLETIRRGIEEIQLRLSELSPMELMQELEVVRMWVLNKENE